MSPTHDYVIANGTGSSVRSDINDALAAVVSQNSSSTAPATTYAYMIWVDTTTNIVKMRNGANSAWIELFETDGEFGSKTFNGNITLNAQGDLRFADSDSSNWVAFQAPATVASNVTWTLPSTDGTNGQALTTNGSGTLSWTSAAATTDKITEGNTEAEVVDTGSDGHFKVTTEGTERLRVDSSGRLLVGTSTARANFFNTTISANLQIEGTSTGTTTSDRNVAIISSASLANSGGVLILAHQKSGTIGGNTAVASGDNLGYLTFQGSDGTDFVEGAAIAAEVDGTPGANDMPGRLVFLTTADGAASPTERMRIKSDGQLNTLSSVGGFYATVTAAAGTTIPTFAGRRSGTTLDNGTDTCYIWSNGNIQNTNGSYTAISDQKLKENIVDANSQWNDLKAIQIRNWNFKEETGHETHRQIGPIAQELEGVCPGLVFETPDRDADGNETGEVTKGVNQSVLYMKAVKALQEAMERIETLEAKVAALESA